MDETRWILSSVFPLFLFGIVLCSPAMNPPRLTNKNLFEGYRCRMENNRGEGVCRKMVDCPSRMQEVRDGMYSGPAGRCGFTRFDEIVCCGDKAVGKSSIRGERAKKACEEFKKKIKNLLFPFQTVVFNGEVAKPGEFPHMAALGFPAQPDDELQFDGIKYICGGTLISEKHVLTAAHCVNNIQGFIPVEVMLGTNVLGVNKSLDTQRIPISRIVVHPRYKRSTNYDDVAILELAYSVNVTFRVLPTCLSTIPPSDTQNGGERNPNLIILGWGAIDLDGTTSTKLLKAENLRLVEKTECSKSYKNIQAQIPNGLDDGMICVGDPNSARNADTCWGDSGGPLLVNDERYFPLVVGVTSFGQACGGKTPGVYASVYKYLEWIEDQVWSNVV